MKRIALLLAFAAVARGDATPPGRDVVAWGRGGYRFRVVAHDAPSAGFSQPGFDDGGWATAGRRGLGSGNLMAHDGVTSANGCPLVADGWPRDTDLLVRQPLDLPGGQVEIGFAADNDLEGVWWNGALVASHVVHEGCATRDWFVLKVEARPGRNLLAVRVIDRGWASYYDHRVTLR